MAIDSRIPLMARTVDTSNALAGLVQNRQMQEQQSYDRGIQQQQLDRQAKLDARSAQSQGLEDQVTRERLVMAQFQNLEAREQARIRNVAIAAAQVKPYLDRGDTEGALNFAINRQKQLHARIGAGEGIDDADTAEFINILKSGKIDDAKQMINGVMEVGYMTGIFDRPSSSHGGATGDLVDRLRKENPNMSTQEALSVIRGGGQTTVDENGNVTVTQPPKPLPATALKLQNEALDALSTSNNINADLGVVSKQISDGKLKLGLIRNVASKGMNYTGNSDESSRNFATFQATLEKLRNDSLRLNKGVQTDGDAVRAWDELLANVNDEKLVQKRLGEIQGINKRAAELKKLEVENTRSNYGQPTMDYNKYEKKSAIGADGFGNNANTGIKFLGFE